MDSDSVTPRVLRPGQVPPDLGPTVVTLGMFDGVHRGHQTVLSRVAAAARARGLPAGAVTFDRHPLEVLRPGHQPPLLTSLRRKLTLLAAAGMDFVVVLPFTPALSHRSAEDFAARLLYGELAAAEIVVGANLRFGHRAAGDVDLLTRMGATRGARVTGITLAEDGGHPISSTRIRELLTAGDVTAATALLGRPHAVEGRVVRGAGRGGPDLGMPTANLRVHPRLLIPAKGIYAGHLAAGPPATAERGLPAAVSIGVNPTFNGTRLQVEAHVLDADVNLYGRRVTVTVEHRLRDELRFTSVDELIAQMHADVDETRRLLTAPAARNPDRPHG